MTVCFHRLSVTALLLVLSAFVGCASPGPPQPPSLKLPKPVDDLTAHRKGDRVLLTWTPPQKTTDNQNLRHAGPTLICRAINNFPMANCGPEVGSLNDIQVVRWKKEEAPPKREYADTIPAA